MDKHMFSIARVWVWTAIIVLLILLVATAGYAQAADKPTLDNQPKMAYAIRLWCPTGITSDFTTNDRDLFGLITQAYTKQISVPYMASWVSANKPEYFTDSMVWAAKCMGVVLKPAEYGHEMP